jgi:hypothetical protein
MEAGQFLIELIVQFVKFSIYRSNRVAVTALSINPIDFKFAYVCVIRVIDFVYEILSTEITISYVFEQIKPILD